MSYDSYIENINESRRLMNNMINVMNHQERNMRIIINNRNNNRNNRNNTPRTRNNRNNIWENLYFVSDPFNYSRNTSIQLTRDELNRANQENITTPSNIASNVPTRMQIEAATNTTTYSVIEYPSNSVCPISRDVFNDDDIVTQIIPCGHIFSRNNLQQWFTYHSVCPMCRYDIRNYTNNTTTANTSRTNTPITNTTTANTSRTNSSRSNTPRTNTPRTNSTTANTPRTNTPRTNTTTANTPRTNTYTTLDNLDLNNIVEQIAGDILNNVTDISANNISLEYSLYTPYNRINNSSLIPVFNRAVNHRTSIDPSLNF